MITKFHIGVLVTTLALTVGGLSSYTLISNGYFPVAKVGGQFISYHTVKENIEVSKRIYSQGLAGPAPELDILFKRGNEKDLIRNSLENLITNQIIKSEVSADVIKKANQEIQDNFDASATANLTSLVKNVYGWDINKFKDRILEPQALLDVLNKEKGKEFGNWLKTTKTKTDVSLWFVPFEWQGGELKSK